MKYSKAKQSYPDLLKKSDLWVKKFSEIHISEPGFGGLTLCGRTMLGNNYSGIAIEEDREVCPQCLSRGVKDAEHLKRLKS